MKHLVKNGREIVGFVGSNYGNYYYAFGKPSQREYLAFDCQSVECGISEIKRISGMFNQLKEANK